jgi:CRISPR/Cas system-associated exonuclease Cas4 (RecB family)
MEDAEEIQRELPLPFPELTGDVPLLPARMVNEFEYCPRLAYLEWVQGEWSESADTVEGKYTHRRVNERKGDLPAPGEAEEGERIHARSITLSSNRLGLIAKLDFVSGTPGRIPRQVAAASLKLNMFPARAGMNRMGKAIFGSGHDVPRSSGDEPSSSTTSREAFTP